MTKTLEVFRGRVSGTRQQQGPRLAGQRRSGTLQLRLQPLDHDRARNGGRVPAGVTRPGHCEASGMQSGHLRCHDRERQLHEVYESLPGKSVNIQYKLGGMRPSRRKPRRMPCQFWSWRGLPAGLQRAHQRHVKRTSSDEMSLTSTLPAVESSIASFASTVARSWLRLRVNLATAAIWEPETTDQGRIMINRRMWAFSKVDV